MRGHPTCLVEVGGHAVVFYQFSSSQSAWELQHFWDHPSVIGRGIGRRLFARALAYAAKRGATYFTIGADPDAEGLARQALWFIIASRAKPFRLVQLER